MKFEPEKGREDVNLTAANTGNADRQPMFRTPQIVSLGTASELIRRNGSGHLIDGTGGWWVWGS